VHTIVASKYGLLGNGDRQSSIIGAARERCNLKKSLDGYDLFVV